MTNAEGGGFISDDGTFYVRGQTALARWAAAEFASYSVAAVHTIVRAVAGQGAKHAAIWAERTVQETGMGNAADKTTKNLACTRGMHEEYGSEDLVNARVDTSSGLVSVPKPAGVVVALIPSTNPVATACAKVICALLSRSSIILVAHPRAYGVTKECVDVLREAGETVGMPIGAVQIAPRLSVEGVQRLMGDPDVDLIVATGGGDMVTAAHSLGKPALGVGPGNAIALVERSADLALAAREIVTSKAFDNSLLCTNDSVLITEDVADSELRSALQAENVHVLAEDEVNRAREVMFHSGVLNREVVGQSANDLAHLLGVRVPDGTRLLLAPVGQLAGEPLTHEKLSPLLAYATVPGRRQLLSATRELLAEVGKGHSSSVFSRDSAFIARALFELPVLRIAVNAGNSMTSSGLGSALPTTMTIGTGFLGGSNLGENLQPKHFVNWAVAAPRLGDELDPRVGTLADRRTLPSRMPPIPEASNQDEARQVFAPPAASDSDDAGASIQTPTDWDVILDFVKSEIKAAKQEMGLS